MHLQQQVRDPQTNPAQDTRHPDPMEQGHRTYDNKSLLEQGLGRGSRLRTTQGEKQKETPEYSGQGLGCGSRFFANQGEKQKEEPKYSDMLTNGVSMEDETEGKQGFPRNRRIRIHLRR